MNASVRFHEAAMRVLQGDESREAAGLLEAVVLDDYPGDERFDELIYVLSLYSPGMGAPYCDAKDLRDVVRRALATLGDPASGG
ncbi:hypothetical protein [Cellulomonas bogoriensis]|uniref:Colicin immunity protein n=1 Tax=Cellulomonas bogoriensis 69B4 = DSM 16987 TaxID=1386082 RepID=A0A0A0C0V9_9CELL|nr:hypothetical protein [Cellulomonas bogoriensis]KGM13800.1 hypothetical protein N869_09560 [Cellulomonas bogoriensis 69B4 = DSM 16987]